MTTHWIFTLSHALQSHAITQMSLLSIAHKSILDSAKRAHAYTLKFSACLLTQNDKCINTGLDPSISKTLDLRASANTNTHTYIRKNNKHTHTHTRSFLTLSVREIYAFSQKNLWKAALLWWVDQLRNCFRKKIRFERFISICTKTAWYIQSVYLSETIILKLGEVQRQIRLNCI